jgi:hypothetical protein
VKDLFELNRRWIYIVMLVGGMAWGIHLIYTVVHAAQR